MEKMSVQNLKNQSFLGHVLIAKSFKARTKGLLGSKELPDYQGLLINPCMQVHTIGMNYPISIWFVNYDNKIIRIIDELKPYRISPCLFNSHYVIEFPANWAEKTGSNEGDYLKLFK